MDIDSNTSELFKAVSFGNKILVERLLDSNKLNIDQVNERGQTPLMIASINGFEDIVLLLLEHGACYKKQDFLGYSAAKYARLNCKRTIINCFDNQENLAYA